MKSLVEKINESILAYAKYKNINKYKDEFFKIITPYIDSLKDESKCPAWADMLNTIEEGDNLQVLVLYSRATLLNEVKDIIPSNTDGHKLVNLFDKIEKIANWF